jgi:hypothetical protein
VICKIGPPSPLRSRTTGSDVAAGDGGLGSNRGPGGCDRAGAAGARRTCPETLLRVALAGTGASSRPPADARAAVLGLEPAARVGRSRGRASPVAGETGTQAPRARACRPHRRVRRPTSIRAMVSALATRMVSSSSDDGVRRQTQPSALSFLAPTPSSRIISVAVRPVYTASSLSILAGISALLPRQRPQAR